MNAKRSSNADQSVIKREHMNLIAARHVVHITREFFSPKLTPSLPRCVKAGVNFRDENRNEELKTGGERELELREKGV